MTSQPLRSLVDSDGTVTPVTSQINWCPADIEESAEAAVNPVNPVKPLDRPVQPDAEILPSATMARAMRICSHINRQQAERAEARGEQFMAIYHRQAAEDFAATAERLYAIPAPACRAS